MANNSVSLNVRVGWYVMLQAKQFSSSIGTHA